MKALTSLGNTPITFSSMHIYSYVTFRSLNTLTSYHWKHFSLPSRHNHSSTNLRSNQWSIYSTFHNSTFTSQLKTTKSDAKSQLTEQFIQNSNDIESAFKTPETINKNLKEHNITHFKAHQFKQNSQNKTSLSDNGTLKLFISKIYSKLSESSHKAREYFESHLLISYSITACTLFSLGDIICQKLQIYTQKDSSPIDFLRTLRLGIFAFFFTGPSYAIWYGRILKNYVSSRPPTFFYKAFMPTLLDTYVLGPIFLIIFMLSIPIMSGDSKEVLKKKFKTDFPFALLIDFIVWPPIQLVNFTFVPPYLQGLVVCLTDLLWAIFLSWISSKKHTDEVQAATD